MELNHSYQQLLANACSSKITDFFFLLLTRIFEKLMIALIRYNLHQTI
jgi:hypothetical protein